ncbi:MAG: flagellar assembly protein FliW [Rhodocyclaceae bacterium]|nr:flagellar assembly protein FliW [Rhodocyclaceae bacterium]
MSPMNIDTPRAGTLEVAPEQIIEFPNGLPGFEDCKRYTLLAPEGAGVPRYFILQSLDDAAVAFTIADPALFGFHYEIELSDEETAALELTDPAEAAVVVMLLKEPGSNEVRANLKAPLIINVSARRGIQHVFARLTYQVTLKSPE